MSSANGMHEVGIFVTGASNPAYLHSNAEASSGSNNGLNNNLKSSEQSNGHVTPETSREVSQKDRGYAWVVMVVSTVNFFIKSVGAAIPGIILLELKDTFTATEVELNVSANLQLSISLCIGIIASIIVSLFGARPIIMGGSLIATAGFLATIFVPSIYMFMLTFGIVSGIGYSFISIGSIVIVYDYFDKYKAVAMGIMMTGHNLGNIVWPPVVTVIFQYYGWRGGFFILAGVYLNMLVLAGFMRPVPQSYNDKKETSACSDMLSQVNVLKNANFIVFCVYILLGCCGFVYGLTYLPSMAKDMGATDNSAALLLSINGILSCIASGLSGFLGDLPWLRSNRLTICFSLYAITGISKICSIYATTYTHLAVYSAVDGFTNGGYLGLVYTVGSDLVLPNQYPLATGIIDMMAGLGLLIGNSFTGWLLSYFGNLSAPAISLGSIQIFAALITAGLWVRVKQNKNNSFDIPSL